MATSVFFAVAVLFLAGARADTNVSNYVYWKKADITAWHSYFPSRALLEELLTNQAAKDAVNDILSGLNNSLSSVVSFQTQELLTAEELMAGTEAEGCVAGIAGYMNKSISEAISTYSDCAADALSKLSRLNNTWTTVKTTYLAAYQRALNGIDVCAKTYPNKDSIARLKSCVDAMNNNYFKVANATQDALYPSPSMTYFQGTVVGCASRAAVDVATKGKKFLNMLVECAKLSLTIDPVEYAEELDKWPGYNDTLSSQISIAQYKNHLLVWEVEDEMHKFYSLQKLTMETYSIQSRGFSYYLTNIYTHLSDYFNTVLAASLDNPGDLVCAQAAQNELNTVARTGANKSLICDQQIVESTVQIINLINGNFSAINNLMPSIGNPSVLSCFSQGYIFAPNTVLDCYNLVYLAFKADHSDRYAMINQGVGVLAQYIVTFFMSTDLPCGGTSLQRTLLGGEIALYGMQRCLYTSSGTTYSVTTPQPVTSYYSTHPSWITEEQTPTIKQL